MLGSGGSVVVAAGGGSIMVEIGRFERVFVRGLVVKFIFRASCEVTIFLIN